LIRPRFEVDGAISDRGISCTETPFKKLPHQTDSYFEVFIRIIDAKLLFDIAGYHPQRDPILFS
jgi:hypothetical protein